MNWQQPLSSTHQHHHTVSLYRESIEVSIFLGRCEQGGAGLCQTCWLIWTMVQMQCHIWPRTCLIHPLLSRPKCTLYHLFCMFSHAWQGLLYYVSEWFQHWVVLGEQLQSHNTQRDKRPDQSQNTNPEDSPHLVSLKERKPWQGTCSCRADMLLQAHSHKGLLLFKHVKDTTLLQASSYPTQSMCQCQCNFSFENLFNYLSRSLVGRITANQNIILFQL